MKKLDKLLFSKIQNFFSFSNDLLSKKIDSIQCEEIGFFF